MNPPTVLCHLAGSLTQSIRSNEPQLIFTRDEEIGSLQPGSIPLFICGPVLKSTWKIGVWGQNKSRRAHKSREVSEKEQRGGAETETGCGQLEGKKEKGRRRESATAGLICLPTECYCSANCFINPVSLYMRRKRRKQDDWWALHARNNVISAGCVKREEGRRSNGELRWRAACPLNTWAVTTGYRLQYVIVATNLSWQELIGSFNVHSPLIAALSSG